MAIFSLKKIVAFGCLVLVGKLSCKREFCEKDDNTGLCKVDGSFGDDDDDGPCWIQGDNNDAPKKTVEERLVRLDGVKVFFISFIL